MVTRPLDPNSYDHLLKIVFVGDAKVGKSKFLARYVDDDYQEDYDRTLGFDVKITRTTVDEHKIKLQIWDKGLQPNCGPISYFANTHGIILMYDVTNRASFDNVEAVWLPQIQREMSVAARSISVILIGNKTDLESQRKVFTVEGQRLATELNFPFFEVSAKQDCYVNEAMRTLVTSIKRALPPITPRIRTPTPPVSEEDEEDLQENVNAAGSYSTERNPNADKVPLQYERFQHAMHCHRLFYGFGQKNHYCNVCLDDLNTSETRFFCQRCDFDMCVRCFVYFVPFVTVPLAADDGDLDERVGLPTVLQLSKGR